LGCGCESLHSFSLKRGDVEAVTTRLYRLISIEMQETMRFLESRRNISSRRGMKSSRLGPNPRVSAL